MRILIISSVAQKGSIGSILTILKKGYEKRGFVVKICYGNYKEKLKDETYYPFCTEKEFKFAAALTRLFGKEGFYSNNSTKRLLLEIERFNPDVVHLTNVHAYYMNEYDVFDYLKKKHIPTIYSMFDAYAFTGKCAFPMDCNKYLSICGDCGQIKEYPRSLFFDRSEFLFLEKEKAYSSFANIVFVGGCGIINQANKAKLLKGKEVCQIEEPQDLDNIFYPRDTLSLKQKLGIPTDNKVVLAAVPLDAGTERKAGRLFLELYKKMKNEKGYSFVYIGFNTTKYGNPEGMIKIPFINSPDEFATYLSLGDVLFYTSIADTTPCTVIDALACGTPIVGFDIEGMTCFNINNQRIMQIVPLADVECVKDIIEKVPRKDKDIIKECRESVYSRFNADTIVSRYLELYERVIHKGS